MIRVFVAAIAALMCSAPRLSSAQLVLTLDDVVVRAREQAAPVAVARARVAEAEAAVVGASARFRDNPTLEAAAGPRRGGGEGTIELDFGVSQQFETGGQRRARIDAATAAVGRAEALVAQAARDTVFDAASAFLRGLAATEHVAIAEEADAVGRDLLAATERRYAAGDIAAIDLNLARIEAARSAAAVRAARAELLQAAGELRLILRIAAGDPIQLAGSLDVAPTAALESLRQSAVARPQFAALEAEGREAEAELRLGRAQRRPDIAVRVGYEREETDNIVIGGLQITLPRFQSGQGVAASAAARATRVRLELDSGRQTALAQLETAVAVHRERLDLIDGLMAQALPGITDNESLARRSYDAGELNLMNFLLIRRDALETRLMIIERRLEAAQSRLEIDYLAGVLR